VAAAGAWLAGGGRSAAAASPGTSSFLPAIVLSFARGGEASEAGVHACTAAAAGTACVNSSRVRCAFLRSASLLASCPLSSATSSARRPSDSST
jgi:hypothetical protein